MSDLSAHETPDATDEEFLAFKAFQYDEADTMLADPSVETPQ